MGATIIQTPGAIDTAAQAFQNAFVTARQLMRQREQLQLERDRTMADMRQKEIQASEIAARTALANQEIHRNDVTIQGHRLAMQAWGNKMDQPTFEAMLAQSKDIDPDVAFAARQSWQGMQDDQIKAQQALATLQQTQLQVQNLQHDQTIQKGVADELSRYNFADLANNPRMAAQAIARVSQIDVKYGNQLWQTLNGLSPNYQYIHGPTGDLYAVNPKNPGDIVNTGVNLGSGAAGRSPQRTAQVLEAMAIAESQFRLALKIAREHPGADRRPVVASGVEGIGRLPLVGDFAKGFARPGAQALRTSWQQQYNNAITIGMDAYMKTMPSAAGPRGQAYLENWKLGIYPEAASDDATLAQARRSVQMTADILAASRQALTTGKQVDFSQLPGFNGLLQANAQDQTGGQYQATSSDATEFHP